MSPEQILDFWFEQTDRQKWFVMDKDFDILVSKKFSSDVEKALSGEYADWNGSFPSRLALILLLDQMTRNIYRETPSAFSGDALALSLSLNAIVDGQLDAESDQFKCCFLLLPMMHSEDIDIQNKSIPLFEKHTGEHTIKFAHLHKDIIDRFGRFPHRNSILGRESTEEEVEFLQQPNSSF